MGKLSIPVCLGLREFPDTAFHFAKRASPGRAWMSWSPCQCEWILEPQASCFQGWKYLAKPGAGHHRGPLCTRMLEEEEGGKEGKGTRSTSPCLLQAPSSTCSFFFFFF